ncbi:MAG: phosphatase PAP2 family protein [Bryobacteraceae bacterium]
MGWFKFRTSEWVLIGFFTYVALLSPAFPDRPHLRLQPLFVVIAVFLLLLLLARAPQARVIGVIRDWLPIVLTLAAFREMELFLPPHFDLHYETEWIRWDHLLLDKWRVRTAIESLGSSIPFYLELCYLLVYGLPAYCIAVLYAQRRGMSIDRFFTVYLVGTLTAYALFPFFPSQPPRVAFPAADAPSMITWVGSANLFVLSRATIHVGVFPSAHVSSAFSSAWAMFLLLPKRKSFGWGLLCYALSVSVATVYGRYHYAADVLAGFGISLLAAGLCLWFRGRPVDVC